MAVFLFYGVQITIFYLFPEGMNQRNGTDVDAANAMKVFGKLGYKTKVYNDQSVDQMVQVLTCGKLMTTVYKMCTYTNKY